MPRLVGVRDIWTFVGFVALSMVALPVGPFIADQMLEAGHDGSGLRTLSVIVGIAAPVPLVALMVWLYRRSDEVERHVMLLQWGVAFAANALLDTALDRMQFASFIAPDAAIPRWWLAIIAWVVGMIAVRIASRGAS